MNRRIGWLIVAAAVAAVVAWSVTRQVRRKITFQPQKSIEEIQREQGAPVVLAPPVVTALVSYITLDATIEPIERAEVMAQVEERVLRVLVEEGDEVRGGDEATLLVEMDDSTLRAREAAARAALEHARAEKRRAEKLLAEGGISRQNLDLFTVRLEAAEADWTRASADLSFAKIRAPITGRVSRRLVEPGSVTKRGGLVMEIVDSSSVKIRIQAPERHAPLLRTGMKCLVRLDAFRDTAPIETEIAIVNPTLDAKTRQLTAICHVRHNLLGLTPGMHGRADLELERKPTALAIPADAAVTVAGREGVFVAEQESGRAMARFRPVAFGLRNTERIEVLEGLGESDLIVVEGQKQIKNGMLLRPVPAAAVDQSKWDR